MLEKLPKGLQDVISSLTHTQLSYLQSALSHVKHFDFFGLPKELRFMVSRCLLCNSISKSINLRSGEEESLLPGLSLMIANKQIMSEMFVILHESRVPVFKFDMANKDVFEAKLRSALARFAKVEIEVFLEDFLVDSEEGSLSVFLRKLVLEINALHPEADNAKPPKVHLCFHGSRIDFPETERQLPKRSICHPAQKFHDRDDAYEVRIGMLFLQVQPKKTIEMIASSLCHTPGQRRTTLTSNVDHDWPDDSLQLLIIDAKLVSFKDAEMRKMGVMQLSPAGPPAYWTIGIIYDTWQSERSLEDVACRIAAMKIADAHLRG